MKLKTLLTTLFTLSLASYLQAQTTVQGKIVDAQGKGLSDITIQSHGYSTKTKDDGSFSLYIGQKGDLSLVISGVGYQRETLKVSPKGDQTLLSHVVIKKIDHHIDEIEVVGYNSHNNKTISVGKSGIVDKDLPQAVQIINNEVMTDQQVNTLGDALKNANGIALGANRGGVGENFYARGYSLGANNIFKNGARTNNGGQIEASTLESVEILKGSAALLYGGVTGGAVVNLVTKKPKFELGGEVAMRYGSWDRYKPTLDVYGPLSQKVAFRFIGTGESAKSYRDMVTSNRVYINPSVLYKISDRSELSINFDYLKSDYTPDFGIGSVDGKINESVGRNTFLNVRGAFNKTNSTNGQVAYDHRFNDHWKLNTVVSLQRYDRNYYGSERIRANAKGEVARALNKIQSEEFTTNQQFNLTGQFNTGGIKHQIILGGDADQSIVKAYAFNIYANKNKPDQISTAYDVINVFDPSTFSLRTDIPRSDKNTLTNTTISRYGAFVQDLISVTDQLKVLAGVRYTYQNSPRPSKYTYEKQKKELTGTSYDDKAWSPKFGLIYQPISSMSAYVSYASNFISNTSSLDVNFQPLGPSLVDQYEAGIKNDFLKGRISANLTWYRIVNNKFTQNLLLPDGTFDSQRKEFSGKSASDGIELDVTGQIAKGLNIMAGYAYNFMRYTDTQPIVRYTRVEGGKDIIYETSGNQEGVRLVGTTAHTGNATIFYTLQDGGLKGLKVGASAFYTGKRNGGWNNTKINVEQGVNRLIPIDPFTTFDFSLGYTIGKLSLLAKVANITNEFNYFVHENYSVNPIPPRNFMTTLSYKF